MQHYILTVPEDMTGKKLKSALEDIIIQHNGSLIFDIEAPSQWGKSDTKIYEIPYTGTVTTMTNEKNYFEGIGLGLINRKIKYSALVAYTGFDENSEEFKNLVEDIELLEK